LSFVQPLSGNLRITDHDGLTWVLRSIDPTWPLLLRRLVRDIERTDQRHADQILEELPPMWRMGHDLGWDHT
jgi:hypothetical protein